VVLLHWCWCWHCALQHCNCTLCCSTCCSVCVLCYCVDDCIACCAAAFFFVPKHFSLCHSIFLCATVTSLLQKQIRRKICAQQQQGNISHCYKLHWQWLKTGMASGFCCKVDKQKHSTCAAFGIGTSGMHAVNIAHLIAHHALAHCCKNMHTAAAWQC